MSLPTGKSAMVKRRSANKAMELMQTRLQELTKRCNKFQAKYAKKPEDTGHVDDSISITFRSPIKRNFGTASAGHCLATCTCLHTACISHVAAPACSNAALADDTASEPASTRSIGIAPATPTAYPTASGVQMHHIEGAASLEGRSVCNHGSCCRSKGHAGRANTWHQGECRAHAISSRKWLPAWSDQQVRQGLSHRQVLQQGIVQLQQQLAQELDMMVQQRMDAARHHFTHDIRCR